MTSWTLHFLAPIILMSLSALVLSTLGVLHLVYTFRGPKLTPRDPDLQARMAEVHPVITRGNAYPEILFNSPFLLVVGLAMLGGFAVLGKVYWFRIPFRGIVISLACYLASIATWWWN